MADNNIISNGLIGKPELKTKVHQPFQQINIIIDTTYKRGMDTNDILKSQDSVNELDGILKETAVIQRKTGEKRNELSKHVQALRKLKPTKKKVLAEGEVVVVNGKSFVWLDGSLISIDQVPILSTKAGSISDTTKAKWIVSPLTGKIESEDQPNLIVDVVKGLNPWAKRF